MKIGDLVNLTRSVWPQDINRRYIGVVLEVREESLFGYISRTYKVFFPNAPSKSWNEHFWNEANLKKVINEV